MKKSELIDLLFNMFDKEKKIIKKNLIMYSDNMWLQVKDKNIKIKLQIDVEHEKNI